MKLELKHLAPYLPYNLRILRPDNKTSLLLIGLNGNLLILSEKDNTEKYGHIKKNKPILRPLSDLIKQIGIEGKCFTPLIELAKMVNAGSYDAECLCGNDIEKEYTVKFKNGYMFRYYRMSFFDSGDIYDYFKLFEKLFEWGFDIFGLIDAGLAVDINSLTK